MYRLIKAIDNFDLGQNVRFSTYAVPMVIGEIRRYLRDNNAVRVSRSLRDIAYKALQAREKLVNANEAEPSISQIAQELAIPRRKWYLPGRHTRAGVLIRAYI
jgi:RNA polymerase sporulation-specific sigma factor